MQTLTEVVRQGSFRVRQVKAIPVIVSKSKLGRDKEEQVDITPFKKMWVSLICKNATGVPNYLLCIYNSKKVTTIQHIDACIFAKLFRVKHLKRLLI